MKKHTEVMQHFAIEQDIILKEIDNVKISKVKAKAVVLHLELLHRYRYYYHFSLVLPPNQLL